PPASAGPLQMGEARRPNGAPGLVLDYWCYERLLANRGRSRGTPSLADEGDEASAEQGQAEGAEADGQGDDAGRGGLGADGASGGANGLNDGLAVRAEDLVAGPSGRA